MTTLTKLIGAGALAVALAACGQQSDDYPGATPDAAGLTLELAGGAPEGLSASTAPLVDLAVAPDPSVDELAQARGAVRALNQEVRRVLERLAEVVEAGGAPLPGEVKVFGPAVRCVVPGDAACAAEAAFRLFVRHHYGEVWSWRLEARAAGSTDDAAWKPVVSGWMRRNAERHRGRGRVVFNLDNLRAATGPAYDGQGLLLGAFGHMGEARSLRYGLVGFKPHGVDAEPLTAGFAGHRTPSGVTRVRAVALADTVAGANPLPREVNLGHFGWKAGVGGRGFVVVSNWLDGQDQLHGDVPYAVVGTDHYFFGRGCWGADLAPKMKEWRWCERGLGPAACLATAPVAVEPAGADWATVCGPIGAAEPLPADVGPNAHRGNGPEPTPVGDEPPPCDAPPTGPDDVQPPPMTAGGGMM